MPTYHQNTDLLAEARYDAIDRRREQWAYIDKMRNLLPLGSLCTLIPVEREEDPNCDKWEVHTHGKGEIVIRPCDHLADVEREVQGFLFDVTPEDEREALSAILEDSSIEVGRWDRTKNLPELQGLSF